MAVKYGIVGTGMIAHVHARAIAAATGCELAAVCSRDVDRGSRFASEHGCRAYTSLRSMLEDPDVDVVSICTPSGTHLDSAMSVISSGRSLIVEKPLEITVERCDRILDAAAKADVIVGGVFQSRFSESARVVKRAVEAGRFGSLTLCDAYVKWERTQAYYDSNEWKGTWSIDGGGALMVQGIHAIDLLQWFAGPVRSVQAYAATLGHTGIEVEDTAAAVLRFENGALGVIEGSTAVHPGFLKRIEISGVDETVVLEEEDIKTWSFRTPGPDDDRIRAEFGAGTKSGGGAADPAAISDLGHQRQFEDFARAVTSGTQPFVDGAEARKAVAIIQAIYESARSGGEVSPAV